LPQFRAGLVSGDVLLSLAKPAVVGPWFGVCVEDEEVAL